MAKHNQFNQKCTCFHTSCNGHCGDVLRLLTDTRGWAGPWCQSSVHFRMLTCRNLHINGCRCRYLNVAKTIVLTLRGISSTYSKQIFKFPEIVTSILENLLSVTWHALDQSRCIFQLRRVILCCVVVCQSAATTQPSDADGEHVMFANIMQGISGELQQVSQGQSSRSIGDFLAQLGSEYTLPQGEG